MPLPKWVVFEVVRLPYLKTSVTPMRFSSLPAPLRAAVSAEMLSSLSKVSVGLFSNRLGNP
jgi:hypothetical protein